MRESMLYTGRYKRICLSGFYTKKHKLIDEKRNTDLISYQPMPCMFNSML